MSCANENVIIYDFHTVADKMSQKKLLMEELEMIKND